MKDYSRLKAGAFLRNSPDGLIMADFQPFEGGKFGLTPKIEDGVLYLVDPSRQNAYGFALTGDSESLKAVGNALLKLAREKAGDDPDSADAE